MSLTMLIVYFLCLTGVGLYCLKHATNVHGFVLGGRSVGPWLTAFAYGTSYFSAVIFVGYAGQFGWKYGISAIWIGIGNAFLGSLLAWVILGRRTRIITQHLNSSTMPQFFAARYGKKSLRVGASVIIFVFLVPYTASLYNGLSRLFGMAFHIDYSLCIVLMSALTAIYVILGGYMATAINDFIQGIIMLFGIVAIIGAVLMTNGGFMGSLEALARISDTASSSVPGVFASFFGPQPLSLLFVVVLTSLGTWGLPQMVQKFYSIESESAIKKGTIISTVFAVVVAGGCYFLGGFGRLFSTPEAVAAQGYDSIIPSMLSQLSPFFLSLAVILVLSASMSTLASLVLTSSSTLVMDFCKQTITKKMEDKAQLMLIRILVVVFIAISAVLAIFQYKSNLMFIAQLMGISWGTLAGAFLAPFLYGLYFKKATPAACWVSFIVAVCAMTLNLFCPQIFPSFFRSSINAGVLVMSINLILVPLVSFVTRKPDKALVEHCFSCYETPTQAPLRSTLGE